MNIIICDDEKIYIESIKKKLEQWAVSSNCSDKIEYHTFLSGEDVIESYESGLPIDALFIDIQLPNEDSGLITAKKLHSLNEYIPIVFVTNYSEYAMEGYTVNALRFLHKPITQQMIDECMNIIWKQWLLKHKDSLTLETATQYINLPLDNIMYIEILGHNCIFYTTDETGKYITRKPLYTFEDKLPPTLFVHCHRSYIINLMYIRKMEKNEILMSCGTTIAIGKKYRSDFNNRLRNYYFEEN